MQGMGGIPSDWDLRGTLHLRQTSLPPSRDDPCGGLSIVLPDQWLGHWEMQQLHSLQAENAIYCQWSCQPKGGCAYITSHWK